MEKDLRRLLSDLLIEWEDRAAAGEDVAAGELARHHPDLLQELDRRIRALRATRWLDNPGAGRGSGGATWNVDRPTPAVLLAGRYQLDERVGTGGSADVWKAFDLQLQRVVAVKVPKRPAGADDDAGLREARRVAALRHPGIVTVYDVGQDGDRWFIVSEFVSGGSLANRLDRGAILRRDAVRWVGQVADALHAAHRDGVVHRDVKPANILINSAGDALLADFGIACDEDQSGANGERFGTLRFMAPEQLAGGEVTAATDVYALGMVLHQLLSGRVPFRSSSANDIRGEIAAGVAAHVASTMPGRFEAVCRRALASRAEDRYRDAEEFAAAVRAADRSRRRVTGLVTLAVLGILVAVLAARQSGLREPLGHGRAAATTIIAPDEWPSPIGHVGDAGRIAVRFARIDEAEPYVVEAVNVRRYREWQEPPLTYVGPVENGREGRIVYRFECVGRIGAVRLLGTVFCVDFTREAGGQGRGACAVDVSRDGASWVTLRNALEPIRWGEDWIIDEPLPDEVVGGEAVWIRIRMLTENSPNDDYATAQFGRHLVGDTTTVFGLDVEYVPTGDR